MSLSLDTSKTKLPYKRLVTTQNGKSERILQNSMCAVLDICGRCPLLDLPYHKQLFRKTEKTKEFFKKLGSVFERASIKDCISAPEKLSYRHSVHLMIAEHYSNLKTNSERKRRIDIGFYQAKSKIVFDIGRCPIQSLQLNHIVAWLRTGIRIHNVSLHSKLNPEGILDSIILTSTYETKQVFICFVVSKIHAASLRALACDIASKFPNVRGILMRTRDDVENKHVKLLTGHFDTKDSVLNITREKQFDSFFAANPSMTEKLLKRILELQTTYENNYSFSIVTSNQYLPTILKSDLLEDALKNKSEIICFISSLSQSAEKIYQKFEDNGYSPLFVEPFDMLPGTEYIETITLFSRKVEDEEKKH